MSIPRAIYILVLALLALIACSGDETSEDETGGPSPTGDWTLVEGTFEGAEIPVVAGADVTLTIDPAEGTLGGTSACNQYFTSGTIADGVVTVDEAIGSTMMMCADPAVMESEQRYLAALPTVTTAEMDGDNLVLTGPDARLEFSPAG